MEETKNTSNCNECAIDDCNMMAKVIYNCHSFTSLGELKTPMLMHLMMDEDKVQDTVEVLNKFKISIQELSDYPYFKLIHK